MDWRRAQVIVLISVVIVVIPAVAILYPFLCQNPAGFPVGGDGRSHLGFLRRWEAALYGLKNAELERAIGTLTEDDYVLLREEYMSAAAVALKGMELEEREETEFLSRLDREARVVRERFLGPD